MLIKITDNLYFNTSTVLGVSDKGNVLDIYVPSSVSDMLDMRTEIKGVYVAYGLVSVLATSPLYQLFYDSLITGAVSLDRVKRLEQAYDTLMAPFYLQDVESHKVQDGVVHLYYQRTPWDVEAGDDSAIYWTYNAPEDGIEYCPATEECGRVHSQVSSNHPAYALLLNVLQDM